MLTFSFLDGKDASMATAIFDLDGTLTTRDSFLAFLLSFGRHHRCGAALARTPLRLAAYLAKQIPDYRLKQDLIRDFLGSFGEEDIARHAEWLCRHWLPRHQHPIGMQLLQAHRRRGDRIVLLSASPDLFVPAIAEALGISEVICTRIERAGGKVTGQILGGNCKGPKKLEVIRSYLESHDAPEGSYAYGDSRSDRFVLEWVRHGAWIRRRKMEPLRAGSSAAFPNAGVMEGGGSRTA